MSDEPQVHAHLGLIRIPAGSCCEGQRWEEYTPDAARRLANQLLLTAREATQQRRDIEAACADGHDWDTGFNRTWKEPKTTIRTCQRPGCEAQDEQPGWLPFEPKTHVVPDYLTMRMTEADCTGPGCEHCSNEATARVISSMFDNIKIERGVDLWANTTKSQPQFVENPHLEGGYGVAIDFRPLGSCPTCFCLDSSHSSDGCNAETCPCTTDLTKITGMEDTTP